MVIDYSTKLSVGARRNVFLHFETHKTLFGNSALTLQTQRRLGDTTVRRSLNAARAGAELQFNWSPSAFHGQKMKRGSERFPREKQPSALLPVHETK